LKPEEVHGGTFSITNFGSNGSLFGTPVINQPQVAILGVGVVEKAPVVIDDAIAIRHVSLTGLTFRPPPDRRRHGRPIHAEGQERARGLVRAGALGEEVAIVSDGVSRRYFLLWGAAGRGRAAGGFGSVASLRALGYKPYYDRLNVAAIGCGGQGGSILNDAARTENIVALCDLDDVRACREPQALSQTCRGTEDFRVMLDKEGKNIDACTIGIPDHMHATVALACMQRGKHVYVEKAADAEPLGRRACSRTPQ